MRARAIAVLLVLAAACNGETDVDADIAIANDAPNAPLTLDDLPAMPGYPSQRFGRLAVVAEGDLTLAKAWEAEAGICPNKREIELYAEDDSSGTVVVFYYPKGNPEGSYGILQVDSVDLGERAVLVGVQLFREKEALGFQGIGGSAELEIVGDAVTGHFASTLREVESQVLTRYVGVFDQIALVELSDEYCSAFDERPPELDLSPIRRY
jgi:hypothetical protein